MPRAVTTGGTAGGEWGLLAAMAAVVGASAALWLAGGLASAVSGPGWHSASFSPVLVLAVARSGTGSWWPGVDPGLVWGLTAALTGLLVVAALTAYLTWSLRRPASATTAGHGLVLSTIAILPGLRLTQRHDTPRGASLVEASTSQSSYPRTDRQQPRCHGRHSGTGMWPAARGPVRPRRWRGPR
jgi:hypothetical protein